MYKDLQERGPGCPPTIPASHLAWAGAPGNQFKPCLLVQNAVLTKVVYSISRAITGTWSWKAPPASHIGKLQIPRRAGVAQTPLHTLTTASHLLVGMVHTLAKPKFPDASQHEQACLISYHRPDQVYIPTPWNRFVNGSIKRWTYHIHQIHSCLKQIALGCPSQENLMCDHGTLNNIPGIKTQQLQCHHPKDVSYH